MASASASSYMCVCMNYMAVWIFHITNISIIIIIIYCVSINDGRGEISLILTMPGMKA